jgi:hypothetical protein
MNNLEILSENNDYVYFVTHCLCGSEELTVYIENYEGEENIELYYKLNIPTTYYRTLHIKNPIKRFLIESKIKFVNVFKVIFNFPIIYDACFTFRSIEHAEEFSNEILKVTNKIKGNRNKNGYCISNRQEN